MEALIGIIYKKIIFFIKNFDFFPIYDNINIYVLNVSKHVLEYVCYYVDKKIAWRILDCRQ